MPFGKIIGPALMSDKPDVSIVVPLYNKRQYVKRALDSIMNQRCSASFEVVVVDDGSTDGGPAIVGELAQDNDRLRMINQPNCGPGTARNRGAEESTGPLVAFLDADDEWAPDFLALAISALQAQPTAAAAALAYRVVYPNGRVHEPAFRCGLPVGATALLDNYFQAVLDGAYPICSSNVVVRRAPFEHLRGFPPTVRGEDTAFWSSMVLSYPVAFVNTVSATVHLDADTAARKAYRWLPASSEDAKYALSPLDEALSSGLLPGPVAVAVRRYRAKRLAECIRQNLMCGHPRSGRRLFAEFGHGIVGSALHEPRALLYLIGTFLPPVLPKAYWASRSSLWAVLKR
jgi:glycosyltransferase involved in cell wall biosynthesis